MKRKFRYGRSNMLVGLGFDVNEYLIQNQNTDPIQIIDYPSLIDRNTTRIERLEQLTQSFRQMMESLPVKPRIIFPSGSVLDYSESKSKSITLEGVKNMNEMMNYWGCVKKF